MDKRIKTGGRQKGTPNKSTSKFKELIEATKLNIADEAFKLYLASDNEALKLKILMFLAEYCYSKPKAIEDPTEPIDSESDESTSELLEIVNRTNGQAQ